MTSDTLLSVQGLSVEFGKRSAPYRAVKSLDFDIRRGETVALVGESGSGKSVTALSILRLIERAGGRIVDGSARFLLRDGRDVDLFQLDEPALRRIRGNEIAMIFQEPMTSLNPVMTIGDQLTEVFLLHQRIDRKTAWRQAQAMLDAVKLSEPARRMTQYPGDLSGGMRQRVMIAMALACRPDLLIADEPTTALDVTVQAQIIDLMHRLREDLGTSILFISHDLALVAEFAERIAVMYAGQIIEQGRARDVLSAPAHPYTQGLLRAMPRLGQRLAHGRQPLPEISGNVPQPSEWTAACRFASRCPSVMAACRQDLPLFRGDLAGRARCVLVADPHMEAAA